MAWYSKLKSFIDSIFHFDISTIRSNSSNVKIKARDSIVIINNQDREPFSIDKNGERIALNVAKLDERQKVELRDIIKEAYEEEGELLKENLLQYSEQLDEYKEENPDKELLNFFRDKLLREDFEILKVSLFLRSRFKLKENVSNMKSDIIKRFGDRGKNIANLCSTGYFENFIRPLWEIVHKSIISKSEADHNFSEIFELIVKNGLLAVFVHHYMTEDKLLTEIEGKIRESKKYGFAMVSDHLYVHALSKQNVKTVHKWIEDYGTTLNAQIVVQGTDFITVSIPIDHLALGDSFDQIT